MLNDRQQLEVSISKPSATGNYEADCAAGRNYADKVVLQMQETDQPALLGWVTAGFDSTFPRDGVQIGFFHRIAERLMYQN
jgi:hypothetical protein